MQSSQTEFVNTLIRAGAGAGKTYGLIHKIVDLVNEYQERNSGELPRFVVTTFTRKATQEVRERLLAKGLELRQVDPIRAENFLRFLRNSGQLSVSTIHGVLYQFLRQFGYLIGLDPDFKLISNSRILTTEVLHGFLENEKGFADLVTVFGWKYLRTFFQEYHRTFIFNPNTLPLSSEVYQQYWEKKIQELSAAIVKLKPFIEEKASKSKGEALKNYNAALSMLQSHIKTGPNVWEILPLLQDTYGSMPRNLGPLSQWDEDSKALRQVISTLLTEMDRDPWTDRDQFERHMTNQAQLAQIGPQFSQQFLKSKIERAEIELEDLEFLSLYILRNFPKEVKNFTESWNYWFIDEYQDTSPIQVEILDRLIGSCPHYVVGDPQQSIYLFRGARSKVFHEKQNSFANQGAQIEVKSVNRRSQTPALSLINDLMDLVNKLQFSPMDSLPDKASASLLAGHFYLVPENLEEHLDIIVKALERLLKQNVSPETIAILCRENDELRLLLERIEKAGLPGAIVSQGNFYDDRVVRDALSLWHFLVNPYNDLNLIELLRSPWFRLSDSVLLSLRQESDRPLWCSLATVADPVVERLQESLKRIEHVGHLEAWQEGLMNSGLFNEACRMDPSGRKEGNLWKLVTRLHEAERNGVLNYLDPLDLGAETDTNSELEARAIRQSKQIQLMTIHASKGLEFDHIFLPFISHSPKKDGADFWSADLDGNHWSISMLDQNSKKAFPSFFSRQNAEEIRQLLAEENERLFYVAITRTKKTLHFFPPSPDHSDFSKGWARHLHPFINREPGIYSSDNGEYEFEIIDGSKMDFQPYHFSAKETLGKSWPALPDKIFNEQAQSVSVTSLLEDPINQEKRPKPSLKNLDALVKGTIFHRQMESFTSQHGHSKKPIEVLNLFAKNDVPFMEIISQGYPEWSFRIPTAKGSIEGQIDLWGRDANRQIWIIDYKTGSSRFLEKAFLQLQFYAGALQVTGYANKTESIFLVVCYPEELLIFRKELSGTEIQEFMSQHEQK